MKNKLLNNIIVGFLSASMLFSSIVTYPVYAQENSEEPSWVWNGDFNDDGDEDPEEPEEPEEPDDPEPDPVNPEGDDHHDETGWLASSTDRISFGQIEQDSQNVDYQSFSIINRGFDSHRFSCSMSDPDGIWDMEIPNTNIIAPGRDVVFSIRPNTNVNEGNYSGTFVVNGICEEGMTESVTIDFSVVIYKKDQPYVNWVSISPRDLTLSPGASSQMSVQVDCGGGATSDVDWSINGAKGSSNIDSSGRLSIAGNESAGSIQVIAKSRFDSSKSDAVTVNIEKNKYSITTESSPSDGGISTGDGNFSSGDNVTVTANPANKYSFDGWYDNGKKVSDSQKYSFTVDGNRNLVAKFVQGKVRVKVKRNNDNAGTVSDSATLKYGDDYKVKAKPNDGYGFDGWYIGNDKVSGDRDYKLRNIKEDIEITAVFSRNKYNVQATCAPTNGGSVKGCGTYDKGASLTLEAKPADGFEFAGWLRDSQSIGNSKTLSISNLSGDQSFVALFQPKKMPPKMYKLTSGTDSDNGVITPSGTFDIGQGYNVVVTITPKNGYKISDVKVDGKSVGAVSSYTFNNMGADHSIKAFFAANNTSAQDFAKKQGEDFKNNQKIDNDDNEGKYSNSHQAEGQIKGNDSLKTQDDADYNNHVAEHENDLVFMGGSLQDLNITEDEARAAIHDGADRKLMETALFRGDLRVTVKNQYSDDDNETATQSYYDIVSVPNIEDVIDDMIPEDTKIAMFNGMPVAVNLNIRDFNSEVTDEEKELLDDQTGESIKPASYFDVSLLMDVNGSTEYVSTLNRPMQIVAKIPQEMLSSGDEIVVLRLHDGQVSVLKDVDEVRETITFTTDKFSTYAFAYNSGMGKVESGASSNDEQMNQAEAIATEAAHGKIPVEIVVIAVVILVSIFGIVITLMVPSKKKKRKKK